MLNLATECGMLSKLPGRRPVLRPSFYADDVALFINPTRRDITMIKLLLSFFSEVTKLVTNLAKSSALPIRCAGLDLDCHCMREELQPIMDKFDAKMGA